MQWGSCKPIIVKQFAFALCGPGLVIVSLGLLLNYFLGDKLESSIELKTIEF